MTEPSPSPSPVSRRPLLLEGLTIVLSILLAFAIDAWWDTNRDRETDARLVTAGAGEHAPTDFPVDPQQLQRDPRLETLVGSMAATASLIGPP